MKNSLKLQLISSAILILICSCASFEPGWNNLASKTSNKDVTVLTEKANKLEMISATSDEIKLLIDAYSEIEKVDPNNYYGLWKIGHYHILMGAAHSTKTKDKKFHYREAIKYFEKAMYTNADFAQDITEGKEVFEACEQLTIKEIDAMGFWYTARFYYFKECLNPIGKVFNTDIVLENNKAIEYIDKLDPNWYGGGNYFSKALFYIATPTKFGGSKAKAKDEFSAAIEAGPTFIVNRWGRAKYLYSLTGDLEGFKSDMRWVIEQDPNREGNPYPWNIYFQNDAKNELRKVNSK